MGKGKQKIEIKKITKESARKVAFSKRRKGLFKKAVQLESKTGAKVAILVFSSSGKPYTCGDVETLCGISDSFNLQTHSESNSIWDSFNLQTHSESNGIWDSFNLERPCESNGMWDSFNIIEGPCSSSGKNGMWDSFNLERPCSSSGQSGMWDSFNLGRPCESNGMWDSFNIIEGPCSSSGQNGMWDSFNLERPCSSSGQSGMWDSFNLERHCSSSGIPSGSNGIWDSFNVETHCSSSESCGMSDSFNVETHCSSSGQSGTWDSFNVEACHNVNELLLLKAHLESTREKLLESQFLDSLWFYFYCRVARIKLEDLLSCFLLIIFQLCAVFLSAKSGCVMYSSSCISGGVNGKSNAVTSASIIINDAAGGVIRSVLRLHLSSCTCSFAVKKSWGAVFYRADNHVKSWTSDIHQIYYQSSVSPVALLVLHCYHSYAYSGIRLNFKTEFGSNFSMKKPRRNRKSLEKMHSNLPLIPLEFSNNREP
uniref:MADS-box domain-containing protein n=1 Tax=Solanum lycopersicum TaxID=4081 RepID=A0A3Q7EFH4_SOLLC